MYVLQFEMIAILKVIDYKNCASQSGLQVADQKGIKFLLINVSARSKINYCHQLYIVIILCNIALSSMRVKF